MLVFVPWHIIFMLVNLIGVLISLSATHPLSIWLGIEINLIGTMPLLVTNFSAISAESGVNYFLVQSVGSAFIVIGTAGYGISLQSWTFLVLVTLGLMLKLAIFPFYMWFPSVIGGLSWGACFLISTINNIAPIVFLADVVDFAGYFVMLGGVVGGVLSSILGLNQTQLRPLIGYSSINHTGWMVSIIAFSNMAAFFYLGFYTLIVGSIFFTFSVNNLYSYAILKVNNYTILMLVASSVNIMSLIGFPPLIGFVCNLAGFYVLSASPYILFSLVVSSLISFGYYLFIVFSVCISYSSVKGAPQSINWKVLVAQIGFIGLSLLGPIVYGLIFFL